ncbi:MAG: hypothetical protein KIT81_05090 [Alphaproteobacteria bacterium]|nr:hypothetical protein [Alphaproteobacteria bacterium]
MSDWLGSSPGVFIGLTVILFGAAAFMTGRAIAITWRPSWQLYPYGLLLGLTNRFFCFALFEEDLLSVGGFILDTLVILAIGTFAYKVTRAYKMVNQYPWLYERAGLFGWREREGS